MPHADPTPATHGILESYVESGGFLWAGCHAVSVLEQMDGADVGTAPDTNFLSDLTLLDYSAHSQAVPPYNYSSTSWGDPAMQFAGQLDTAMSNGSEQVYLPKNGSVWRPSTKVAIWDPDQSNIPDQSPGLAAKLAYGRAYGHPSAGVVMYEGGHNVAGTSADQIAAQRVFLNLFFWNSAEKSVAVSSVVPPTNIGGLPTTTSSLALALPPSGFTCGSIATSGGTCSSTPPLTCSFGDLAYGDTRTVTVSGSNAWNVERGELAPVTVVGSAPSDLTGTLSSSLKLLPGGNLTVTYQVQNSTNILGETISNTASADTAETVAVTSNSVSVVVVDGKVPMAADAALTVLEDAAATAIGLTAPTDADTPSANLTITVQAVPLSTQGVVALADGTPVTVGRTLTATELTQLTFKPAADFNGAVYDFRYVVTDPQGNLDTALAMFTITPVNDPPVAYPDQDFTQQGVAVILVDLPGANDFDIDGTVSDVSIDLNTGLTGVQTTFTVAGQGTWTIDADPLSLTAGDVTFTPLVAFFGVATIPYTIADDGTPTGRSAVTSLSTLTVIVNGRPTAVNDAFTVTPAGGSFDVTLKHLHVALDRQGELRARDGLHRVGQHPVCRHVHPADRLHRHRDRRLRRRRQQRRDLEPGDDQPDVRRRVQSGLVVLQHASGTWRPNVVCLARPAAPLTPCA